MELIILDEHVTSRRIHCSQSNDFVPFLPQRKTTHLISFSPDIYVKLA